MTKEQIEERKQILRAAGFSEIKEFGCFVKPFPRKDPDVSEGSISFGMDATSYSMGDLEYCEIWVVRSDKKVNDSYKGYPESLEAAQQIANWMNCGDSEIFKPV